MGDRDMSTSMGIADVGIENGSAASIGCIGGASNASRAASSFSPSKPPLILTREIASSLGSRSRTGDAGLVTKAGAGAGVGVRIGAGDGVGAD